MTGKIIKGIAGFYYVHCADHQIYECKAKGIFRNKKIKPLVGDNVEITVLNTDPPEGNIDRILERKSELIRPAVANIDQALVVFAIQDPEPNLNLLDRFLVMMETSGIPVTIAFNKIDLADEAMMDRYRKIYEPAGYPVMFLSTYEDSGIHQIREFLKGKTTALAGPSGVGKSSLTNQILPEAQMETGSISEKIKRGKHTSVKGARQKRFIRFRTLGAGYSEDEIKAVIAGEVEHRPHQKQPPKEQPFHLLVDIQAKLSEGKSEGYARWAKRYNLKEMSKTLIFLQENKIGSIEEMQERVNAATAQYHELGDSIKAAEQRMAEIAVLRTHIVNYARTRPVYDTYRKSGYSKKFLEEHREQITLHKAAKAAFDESNLRTLPKVKELDAEYSNLLTEKKARYPDYRKAKEEMQELLRAKRNVEMFFAEEKSIAEKMKSR